MCEHGMQSKGTSTQRGWKGGQEIPQICGLTVLSNANLFLGGCENPDGTSIMQPLTCMHSQTNFTWSVKVPNLKMKNLVFYLCWIPPSSSACPSSRTRTRLHCPGPVSPRREPCTRLKKEKYFSRSRWNITIFTIAVGQCVLRLVRSVLGGGGEVERPVRHLRDGGTVLFIESKNKIATFILPFYPN